jgi:hypothetical protein
MSKRGVRKDVNGAVGRALDRAVFWTVDRDVVDAVTWEVSGALTGAVFRTVDRAVSGAVYWSVYDSDHPALQDFLVSCEAEVKV